MTDNEIIKALELCVKDDTCAGCPLCLDGQCTDTIKRHSLDLIYRQKAEIERLRKIQQVQADRIIEERGRRYELMNTLSSRFEAARAEAIKEFAEKLKSDCNGIISLEWNHNALPVSWAAAYEKFIGDIDRLLEEMVGEES